MLPQSIYPHKECSVKRLTLGDLEYTASRLLPDLLGERRIASGGLYVFKPGEVAHPEPHHAHDVDEVFIFVQGRGVLPIDEVEYPVQTGDIVIVEAGQDHHTRSSVDDPLVAAWYLMEQ
jgi:quercetin dioxygenase-like cupin family protein